MRKGRDSFAHMMVNKNHWRKSWNTPATDSIQSPVLWMSFNCLDIIVVGQQLVTHKIAAAFNDTPLHCDPDKHGQQIEEKSWPDVHVQHPSCGRRAS